MKKYSPIILVFTTILFYSCSKHLAYQLDKTKTTQTNKSDKKDKYSHAVKFAEFEFDRQYDRDLGFIPRERFWEAYQQVKFFQNEERLEKAAIGNINWKELGPTNVGGRSRAILIDKNDTDSKKVWAASVSGGLWLTENVYANSVEWTPVNDLFSNLAITTIAQNPNHPDTIYFGTGEGWFNADAVRGDGIWKSTDGGQTWSQLSSTNNTNFNYVQKVVVDNNGVIYAATRAGLYRSTDHGTSFTRVYGTTSTRCADVEIDANNNVWLSVGIFNTDGIYKSHTGLSGSFTKVSTSARSFDPTGLERMEIVCAPSDSNYVYVLTQNGSSNEADDIYKTTNGGTSWTALTSTPNFASAQAWYNLIGAVDPNDKNTLIIGGLDLYITTNGGSSFTKISDWTSTVHADHHAIVFKSNSSDTVLFGNDGGIYSTYNASNITPTFKRLEDGYNTTQFYSGTIHPNGFSFYMLGGTQDNGSQQFTKNGLNSTNEVTGGDGGYCHIDQKDPNYQFTTYIYNQYRRSTNNGSSFSSINFSSSNGKFINPFDYDDSASTIYASWSSGNYFYWSNPRTGTSSTTVSAGFTGQVSAVTCDENTSNRVWFGTDQGRIYRVENANSSPSVTNYTPSGVSSGYVSCIAIEDGDADHILATYSNYGAASHIYETTDGGNNWTAVEGNFPDIPVYWAIFSPKGADSALLATELGVWHTDNINGSSTIWANTATGMPNVRVDMLRTRQTDSIVVAFTHGRGAFSTYFFSNSEIPSFTLSDSVVYIQDEVQFTNTSIGATTFSWDFDNDGIEDSNNENPTWAFGKEGYYQVVLTINGSDKDTQIVHVLPNLGTPYSPSDGGNFEINNVHFGSNVVEGSINLWERGAPTSNTFTSSYHNGSNAYVTAIDTDISEADYQCALYTPSFNMTNSGTYTLGFVNGMDVLYCNAPFAVKVEYSINQGNSWLTLGNESSGTNWYNRGVTTCASCCISSSVFSDNTGWTGNFSKRTSSYNISSLAGNSDVRFRILLSVDLGWSSDGYEEDGFIIDDFTISGPSNDAKETDIEYVLGEKRTKNLGANDTVTFYSQNGRIIAGIKNNSSHDYGATTVTIDALKSDTFQIDTNTLDEKAIIGKTFLIKPTTNNTSGNIDVSLYFEEGKVNIWKSITGKNTSELLLIKAPDSITTAKITDLTSGTSPEFDTFGNGFKVSSSFTNGFSGFSTGSNVALPVDFIKIWGERQQNRSIVNWATASEKNNHFFEIQRYNYNKNQFESIGRIEGSGNSNQILEYTFIDDYINEYENLSLLYRIKQIDFDNSYDFSEMLRLKPNHNAPNISVYPNPVNDILMIEGNYGNIEGLEISFYNIEGQLLKTLTYSNGIINVGFLQKGEYLLTISKGQEVLKAEKIIKVE